MILCKLDWNFIAVNQSKLAEIWENIHFLHCSTSICEWTMEKCYKDDIIEHQWKCDVIDPPTMLSTTVETRMDAVCGKINNLENE